MISIAVSNRDGMLEHGFANVRAAIDWSLGIDASVQDNVVVWVDGRVVAIVTGSTLKDVQHITGNGRAVASYGMN